jgi:peptidyl-prolyl cis-trans isomerase C
MDGESHHDLSRDPLDMPIHPERRLSISRRPLRSPEPKSRLLLSAVFLFALTGAARAADTPPAPPPAAAPGEQMPILPAPAQALEFMADHLDKDANFVVANVAGQPITKGDVADQLRAMPVSLASLGYKALFTRAMDELLRQDLAAASARKAGVDKDPVVLRRQRSAADRILAEAWLDRQADAAVTDKALRARYDSDVAGKPGPEEVRARVILVPTESEANDLIAQLRAGADFADLAHKHSKDMSATQGGDIGYVPLDALSAEVGAAMFALAPGQVMAYPVHALPGWFILRIEGRRQRATPTFDEARPVLAVALRREAATAALAALTSDIRVKNSNDHPAPVPPNGAARPSNR